MMNFPFIYPSVENPAWGLQKMDRKMDNNIACQDSLKELPLNEGRSKRGSSAICNKSKEAPSGRRHSRCIPPNHLQVVIWY